MVNAFEFATAARVVFGPGRIRELPALAKPLGHRALVVCGKSIQRAQPILALLSSASIEAKPFSIAGEPTVEAVEHGANAAREHCADLVIGIGGGSALDGAKAIAALATNTRGVFHYLEVVGKAQPLEATPLPVIAVPTTAGTGTEVTRNAVLSSLAHAVKASLRSVSMLPRVALVDPELTHDLPPSLTASTGMDALTQLIEPLVSNRANAITDALCREAIPRAAKALPRLWSNRNDTDARAEMSIASLFSGFALANAGLGAVHGFAAPIGGEFPAPHGAVCAILLAPVMRANIGVARQQNVRALGRYVEVARLLTGLATAEPEDGVTFVEDLCRTLQIPRLRDFSIPRTALPDIATKAAQSSSMKGNPVSLSQQQLTDILETAW
jgi:alcohol dehydrogenase class IV